MGFLTKIQVIDRKSSQQWYVGLPMALAQALELAKAEDVEWVVADKGHLILVRRVVPPDPVPVQKKTSR